MIDSPSMFPTLNHLQITFTPTEYQTIIQSYSRGKYFSVWYAGAEFWGRLPSYLIARCPICQADYTSRLNTYGLHGWRTHPDRDNRVYNKDYQHIGCAHFVAVQTFINLNGRIPEEISQLSLDLDVPFVMSVFLPDDVLSKAVIHTLPICRIEEDTFVPRYSVYMITYYSESPETLWERRRAEEAPNFAEDPEYRAPALYMSDYANAQPELYDLRQWVEREKLCWLDPTSPDLSLVTGQADDFPYINIEGHRRPFYVEEGEIRFPYPA